MYEQFPALFVLATLSGAVGYMVGMSDKFKNEAKAYQEGYKLGRHEARQEVKP